MLHIPMERASSVMAPMPGPPAPTKDATISTVAHEPEDSEGLTDQSNKICNRGPLRAYPEGEVHESGEHYSRKTLSTTAPSPQPAAEGVPSTGRKTRVALYQEQHRC
ncbi:hypothetical protein Taro_011234 [Colocasia esculenta]|uniref:Uncharacterized protein n=1 Tax=Colocasia esculenta TaxID=4460 RepID=A0A843U9N2_COLES|nr:hypothetical protein [Colocasia esculenta]